MSEAQNIGGRPAVPPPPNPPARDASARAGGAPPTGPETGDGVRDLAGKLGRTADAVERMARQGQADPNLATELRTLARVAADPALGTSAAFRHRVAYAVEDLERTQLGRIDMTSTLRDQLTRLAAGAPGLVNERVADMLSGTRDMPDRALVQDIRRMAAEIGKLRDQHGPDATSRIDVIENRLRLAPAVVGSTADAARPKAARATSPPTEAPRGTEDRSPGGAQSASEDPGASGRGSAPTSSASNASVPTPTQHDQPRGGGTLAQGNVLGVLLRGMRTGSPTDPPPWEPQTTPMADRIRAHEQRLVDGKDAQLVANAEQTGRAAVGAMQGFHATPAGATVMARIEAAAKTDPGGMEGVLAEMRAGGRHAELRSQFDNAIVADRATAAAYQRATQAVSDYGRARGEAEPAIARSRDAGLAGRVQELDADIGKLAARTPGREEGKTLMSELTELSRRTVEKAVDAVRAAFRRDGPDATARSSPSPSPGA